MSLLTMHYKDDSVINDTVHINGDDVITDIVYQWW